MLPERVVLFRAWITRAFDQDFAVADDPFVSEAIALFGQVDLAIHGTNAQFDPPPDPKPDNHYWVGPLPWEPRQNRPQYLDESGDPWALVSLSLARQSGEQHLAQIAMNVLSDYPVRTLLTRGDARVKMRLNRFRPTRASSSAFHIPKFLNRQHYLSITPATVLFPSPCTVAWQWHWFRWVEIN